MTMQFHVAKFICFEVRLVAFLVSRSQQFLLIHIFEILFLAGAADFAVQFH